MKVIIIGNINSYRSSKALHNLTVIDNILKSSLLSYVYIIKYV